MVEMIHDRKNRSPDDVKPKYDLLNGLLDACEGDLSGNSKLTERELMGTWTICFCEYGPQGYLTWLGNIFVFLLAG